MMGCSCKCDNIFSAIKYRPIQNHVAGTMMIAMFKLFKINVDTRFESQTFIYYKHSETFVKIFNLTLFEKNNEQSLIKK